MDRTETEVGISPVLSTGGVCLMTPDTAQDLINWLCEHEADIQKGINEFGDLQQIFVEVVGRKAGEVVDDKCPW